MPEKATHVANAEVIDTLHRLYKQWNDEAAEIEDGGLVGNTGWQWRAFAAAKRRCAWELQTVLEQKNA